MAYSLEHAIFYICYKVLQFSDKLEIQESAA